MTLTPEEKERILELLNKTEYNKCTTNRNAAKDAIAAAIIFGGTSLVATALFSAAVSLDLLTAGQARGIQMATRNAKRLSTKHAWETYKETGSIMEALDNF